MVPRHWVVGVVAAATVAVAGCETPTPAAGADDAQAQLLWSAAQCGVERAGARWVADRKEFDTIVVRAASHQVGAEPAQVEGVDFAQQRVVLITRGRKPTPGYGIELAESPLRIDDERALLTVRLAEPDPDAMQAQMLTTPCALVALPRGGYEELRVLDTEGAEWDSLRVAGGS